MAGTVDDPKVPQTQVPEEQSVCGSFQGDTVVAEIVADRNCDSIYNCYIFLYFKLTDQSSTTIQGHAGPSSRYNPRIQVTQRGCREDI